MALNLALSSLNTHEWEVFLEASQAQKHGREPTEERKVALELGGEAEELRGTKSGRAIAACKGVSFVPASQCWWVGRTEALPEPPHEGFIIR